MPLCTKQTFIESLQILYHIPIFINQHQILFNEIFCEKGLI